LKTIFVTFAFALSAITGFTRPAEAQIYSWRDANGVLTLSDRPHNASARTVVAPVGSRGISGLNPQFEPLIRQYADVWGIRQDLIRALIQIESAFNPRAVSPKGAMGLMQLMPATARQFGVLDPFNPADNIRAGVSYFRQLLDKYNDNEHLALAAYNAGPAAVDKHGSRIPPFRETQDYVTKITGMDGTVRRDPSTTIYKVMELAKGRPIVRYTNTKPASGQYEIVSR
jgi:soluble lytic murein transglycosylase-like protein